MIGLRKPAALSDEAGETLAETLVSLLIIAGLFACLATAVVASANINKKAQDQSAKNEFYYTSQDGYEVSKSNKGEVTFTFDDSTPQGSATDKNANKSSVDFCTTPSDDDHEAYSYYEPKAETKSKSAKSKKSASAASSSTKEGE